MLLQAAVPTGTEPSTAWLRVVEELAPHFAARAPACDSSDAFVAENYAELKAHGVFAAGVPRELGGGGASYRSLCEMLQALARACGSTALALSMHTHLVATTVWRWRRDPKPFEPLLRRIAAERLVLATSGASDWLTASGKAERVAGGFRITARKIFASGIPAADLFMTQALYDDPDAGPTVLHFALPVRDPSVLPQDNWRVLGMRGTGSHDVAIQDAFVPDAAIAMRRPAGQWTPLFHVYACMIPLPLIYGVYVGIAEAARDAALAQARKRPADSGLVSLIGEMETDLAAARLAHRDMVDAAETAEPGPETTNRIWIDRTLAGRAVLRTAERAIEAAGGSGLYRATGLERLFRDLQGARFHRPQERTQLAYSGRLALGLDVGTPEPAVIAPTRGA
jgi:alkylation response protein AidB-like acyl-CoA dehydrogenase